MRFRYILGIIFYLINCSTSNVNASSIYSNSKNMYTDNNIYDDSDVYNYSQKCEVYDPYEKLNRKIFAFNNVIDKGILIPIATIYNKTTNDYIKNRVGSFMYNLYEPISVINGLLQGKVITAHNNFWRFVINSTFGVLGIFDIASKLNLKAEKLSISSTFAHYGIGPGPYIMLPLLGGTNMRDIFNLPSEYFLSANTYISNNWVVNYSISGIRIIHIRSNLLPFTDHIYKNSLDRYSAIKIAVHGNSENNVSYPKSFKCRQIINN